MQRRGEGWGSDERGSEKRLSEGRKRSREMEKLKDGEAERKGEEEAS